MLEIDIQNLIRIKSSERGCRLFRNNIGALKDITGRIVRFGLGNDSKKVNEKFKSSDLIGITPVKITPAHIDSTLGIFTSIEVKASNWRYTNIQREQAQKNWLDLIITLGGFAGFANNPEALNHILRTP